MQNKKYRNRVDNPNDTKNYMDELYDTHSDNFKSFFGNPNSKANFDPNSKVNKVNFNL
jgi:hypothetical protein